MTSAKPPIGSPMHVIEHRTQARYKTRIVNIAGQWIYTETGERFHFADHRVGPDCWQTASCRYVIATNP